MWRFFCGFSCVPLSAFLLALCPSKDGQAYWNDGFHLKQNTQRISFAFKRFIGFNLLQWLTYNCCSRFK